MKKKQIFFTFLFLFFTVLTFSQKVRVKSGYVTVDEVNWIKCLEPANYTFSLLNKNDEEIVFIKMIVVQDAEPISQYNKDGSISYFVIKFLGLKKQFELQTNYKDVLKNLYLSKAINEDLTLNEEKIDLLVEKYGNEFSDKYSNRKSETVIIREEPRRSGVNINIGR
ncbi:hypothetical protein [Flavobacterium sp.]|uniref:hypothetical protein n=1 Tax=Flavobacterium sp. TaxID=239 RepID=UPI0038FC95C0